jgi:hypothetical protein
LIETEPLRVARRTGQAPKLNLMAQGLARSGSNGGTTGGGGSRIEEQVTSKKLLKQNPFAKILHE